MWKREGMIMSVKRNVPVLYASVFAVVLLVLSACSSNQPTANSTKAPTLIPTTAVAESTTAATTQATTAATVAATEASATAAASENATENATVASSASAEATSEVSAAASTESGSATVAANASATCTLLNMDTATGDQFKQAIPGFPDRMVREFLEYRPYGSILRFRKEIGKYVGDAQVAEWEKYVFVPVDPNNSDVDTLKQIPGVTDDIAAKLTSGRPYASNQAFVDALGKLTTPDQAAKASCYLNAGS